MRAPPTPAPFPWQTKNSTDVKETLGAEAHPAARQGRGLSNCHIPAERRQALHVARGGRWVKAKYKRLDDTRPTPAKRGKVCGFSSRSRSRLLQSLCQLNGKRLPKRCVMVTLTYPAAWPKLPKTWKRHLENFWARLHRRAPEAFTLWKLEPQQRGAPHFHLLVWSQKKIVKKWVSKHWYEVVKSGDPKHLGAGTNVEPLRHRDHAIAYAGKYCSKPVEGEEWEDAGRWWGWKNRDARPVDVQTVDLPQDQWFRVRRLMRRTLGAKGGYYGPGGPESGCWVRWTEETYYNVLDWLAGELAPRKLPP